MNKNLAPPPFDSTSNTQAHISLVQQNLLTIAKIIIDLALSHDLSKLVEPEKSLLDEVNAPEIEKEYGYGTPEYAVIKERLKEFLDHHYANNPHHPEHFVNGINDMNLMQLLDMLCDWEAASTRHANGSIEQSLAHNRGRFKISPQLFSILQNTAEFLGWNIKGGENKEQPKYSFDPELNEEFFLSLMVARDAYGKMNPAHKMLIESRLGGLKEFTEMISSENDLGALAIDLLGDNG